MSTTPQRIGKYELQTLLGSGSIGEVWKSYDLQYRRDVAIKIFYADLQSDPNFLERLRTQGKLLASLHHPNIVQILDANMARSQEANGTVAYVVMDYIEGPTLADTMRNASHTGAFPAVSDIVSLFTRLGAAIDYAHQHGIIHGNIRPANVLLRLPRSEEMKQTSIMSRHSVLHYGDPVLTDFGIVRPTNGSARSSALYISPEQARGLPPTRHSDIYALGVMLYEICTGMPPFRSEDSVVLMMQHTQMQPIPPAFINTSIPSELSTVILRALAKDSTAGFSSASQMAAALAAACSVHTVLNKAVVEAREPAYAITGQARSIATRSAAVPSTTISALGKNTGPISTILAASTLPIRASQLAQFQFVSRQLSVIPHRPTAVEAPERAGMTLHPVIAGQTLARAVTRTDTSAVEASAELAERVSILRPLWNMRNDERSKETTPLSAAPAPMGRMSFDPVTENAYEREATRTRAQLSPPSAPTETPPPMVAVPSSQALAPSSRTPSAVSAERSALHPGLTNPLALPAPRTVKRLPSIYIWLASILLLVIIGSATGMLYWLHSQAALIAPTSSNAVVGHISFQGDSSGQNDMLRIDLQNIPSPASGKSYYAWLIIGGQGNSSRPTLLGKLPVSSSGQVNFLYAGNAHHSDLLASMGGLLITEEDASRTPSLPSSNEVYTIAFAQGTHPVHANQVGVLNAVRDLLSGNSALNKLGVSGGLAEWLLRDTSKAWLWASNSRDYWQGTSTNTSAVDFIRGQIVHIVDVFEGKQIDPRDVPIARVALLQSNAVAPAYLDASLSQLNTIASDANATADQKALAHMLLGELQQVKNWLQRVHLDAIQLLNLTDQQFRQPQTQSLLDDMALQASDAYNGQVNLSSNAMQYAGMAQIYSDMQHLATFDIVPFKAS